MKIDGRSSEGSGGTSRREAAQTAFLLLLAIAAVGALLVQANRVRGSVSPPRQAAMPPTRVAEWLELRDAGVRHGPASAPLWIVYFSDFECHACRTMHQRLDSLSERYAGRVAVAMLHFPIESLHPHARGAAVGAECAADQARFEEFSTVLFGAQERIGITGWDDFAREAEVPNLPEFRRCIAAEAAHARVRLHEQMGVRLGISGTPTVIVNGIMFDIPPSGAELDSIATEVLGHARRMGTVISEAPTASQH